MLRITPDITHLLSQDQVLVVSFLSEYQFQQYLQFDNFVEAESEVAEVKEILVLHPAPDWSDPTAIETEDIYEAIPACDLECSVLEVVERNRRK